MARLLKKSGSKSRAIRQYKEKHPDAKPKQIAETLNRAGFKVTPQYVSTILSNEKIPGRRDRLSIVSGSSIEQLLAVKKLVSDVGGIDSAQRAIAQYSKLMA